ncbi:MAG: PQQ-dependent sugar dehydrogenase [Chloroflexota bacterium]
MSARVTVSARGVVSTALQILLVVMAVSRADCQQPVTWPEPVIARFADQLNLPVGITNAGDGSGRLFVVEQGGRIRIVRNGVVENAPFLDISGRVLSGGERGLLSIAFPPGYAEKGHFYVNYTRQPDGSTVVARYRISQNPDIADQSTEEVLLVIAQPFANHNGGQLAFGFDGFLYVGMGDGGSGGDPQNNAQNPATLLGKMLRIDVEYGATPYVVPPDNPFVASVQFRPEIWALGLRNPWRFSFDRLTGDLYIADVGQGQFEEVNFQPASDGGGENYGWRIMEGKSCFVPADCTSRGLTLPVTVYSHLEGDCSVTGGMVYRGEEYPGMNGVYLFGDFCSGRIRGLRRNGLAWESTVLLDTSLSISSFGEDESGSLYVSDYGAGDLYRIIENALPMPLGKETFLYPTTAQPSADIVPAAARPVGVGNVANGGATVDIRVILSRFSGPVDLYGAFVLSSDPGTVNILKPDLTFRQFTVAEVDQALTAGVPPPGVEPWKSAITSPVNERVFGPLATADLVPGTYRLYLLAAPAGRSDRFHVWITSFVVP